MGKGLNHGGPQNLITSSRYQRATNSVLSIQHLPIPYSIEICLCMSVLCSRITKLRLISRTIEHRVTILETCTKHGGWPPDLGRYKLSLQKQT